MSTVVLFLIISLTSCNDKKVDITLSEESEELDESAPLTANKVFDEIIPEASDSAKLDTGTEYAYMADAWNVYIAKAVSENVIKIENWDKTLQSDESLKYRREIGSFRIQDVENGFSWIDDAHSAFTFIIQDEYNSEVKNPTLVIFTINNSDSDKYKGTNYDDSIACYTYVYDRWRTYRAIPLTDTLIKVECWYRTSAGDDDKHCFGWDVGVIDTDKTTTDFDWGDANHGAFTITMNDPAGDSDWDEAKLTSFILEDKDYKYATVKEHLDGIKDDGTISTEPVSENSENDLATTAKAETTEAPTTEAPTTEAPATEASETTKKTDTVAYSTNTKDTVKDGNKGIYSYKSRGGTYDNYYIIDFDEGYVYFFSDGNGDTTCDRLRIDSGDLNSVLIITYHDGNDVWSYGLHFKWKNQPDHLILQDNDGFEYDYYTTELDKALKIKNQKTIHDY